MSNFFSRAINAIVGAILSPLHHDQQVPAQLPPLALRITSVSDGAPSIGDTVEIGWDYDSPDQLRLQAVQLHCLAFDGRFATQTFGVLPQALLHGGESTFGTALDLGQRRIQFPFISPVTFHLIAEDFDGRILQKFIKFTLPGMSFSLTVQSGGGLEGEPRLAGPTDGPRVIAFEKAFGIYEATATHDRVIENGLIDQLEHDPFRATFSPDAPFFLSSLSANENEHFRSALGRAFPRLLADFLVGEGRQFQGIAEFVDTVVVAITFAIDGSVEHFAADRGKCDVITSSVIKDLEPIFVQIDTRSKSDDPSHPVVCNLRVGNIPQGLVLARFWDNLDWQGTLHTGEVDIAVDRDPSSRVRATHGQITAAKLGCDIVRIRDPSLTAPAITVIDLAWSQIPIFPDTDLSELFSTQYQLP
jgi:hypothetical protein